MDVQTWFSQLEVAMARTVGGVAGPVTQEEREALLDLARIAAHTSERWAAPISTYLAGIVCADVDPAERATKLRELVTALE